MKQISIPTLLLFVVVFGPSAFAQTSEHALCKTPFVQEALDLSRRSAPEYFYLRRLLAEGSRKMHFDSNHLRYEAATQFNPLSQFAKTMATDDLPLDLRFVKSVWKMIVNPLRQIDKVLATLTLESLVDSIQPYGLENLDKRVSAIQIHENKPFDLDQIATAMEVNAEGYFVAPIDLTYGEVNYNSSVFTREINDRLVELMRFIALDNDLAALLMDYFFYFKDTDLGIMEDAIVLDINKTGTAILAKRSEINYTIGVRFHRLFMFIQTQGGCRRNSEIQEKLEQDFQLPSEYFYPEAAEGIAL